MKPIIEIKNIGKRYDITHQRGGYVALRDVIANVFKNPFSFIKSKAKNAVGLEKKEEFWALKDVSFDVKQGEVIGIIGKNGAGKSTLLKILTGITPPTIGEAIMRGRVSSLLEVGTGFHPELTGRENIFLNGAILGMTKKEIAQKFDEIVEFSGIGKFLDTPVKHYSSGMQVRLAFSVAAHMEPDILIVDEVLAVGDAEFQKKCMGKMEEVTTKQGRTILFVSHNLTAIQELCNKTILIENGSVKEIGDTKEVIDLYMEENSSLIEQEQDLSSKKRIGTGEIQFTNIMVTNSNDSEIIRSDDRLKIIMSYKKNSEKKLDDTKVVISIFNAQTQQLVLRLDSEMTKDTVSNITEPLGEINCETSPIDIKAGRYSITLDFFIYGKICDHIDNAYEFEVVTDIEKYNYTLMPNKHVPEHIIRYDFKDKPLKNV